MRVLTNKITVLTVAALLLVGGGAWWLQAQAPTTPSVAPPTLTPNLVKVNTPTEITATVFIPDPTLNPSSVDLLRVTSAGSTSLVAQMLDNGGNGDQKPGDKIFTGKFA